MAKAGMLSAVCRLIPAADEARRRQEEENQRRVDGMSREELYERAADLERRLIQAVQAEMHE
ncbi:MAG: hypothetical protein SGJ19_00695 [Planctomycetia bacterium]|nr:hypothetical protein [Planctomycetia bacterium]